MTGLTLLQTTGGSYPQAFSPLFFRVSLKASTASKPAIQRGRTSNRVPRQSYQNKEKQKRDPSQPVATAVGPATGC